MPSHWFGDFIAKSFEIRQIYSKLSNVTTPKRADFREKGDIDHFHIFNGLKLGN